MKNYCTLFDSFYLSRGLLMIESLSKFSDDYHLYVFAFDELSFNIMRNLYKDKLTVIPLSEFETPELLAVKKDRTKAEYCWTCTPSIIKHVLENYDVKECTYIDADLTFYNNPTVLLDEMKSDTSTLITEHRYSLLEKIYEEKRAGRFCVQFITFNNLPESKKILNTWADQCIEWCYNRYEHGKFGDQKYLDEWPGKYKGVHILKNEGGGVAPWNIKKYRFYRNGDRLILINKRTKERFNMVFFHFQSLKLKENNIVDLSWHYINKKLRQYIYVDYIYKLREIEFALTEKYIDYTTQYYIPQTKSLRDLIKNLFKRLTNYNIYKI